MGIQLKKEINIFNTTVSHRQPMLKELLKNNKAKEKESIIGHERSQQQNE
jgi:hypothetical protein